MKPSLMFSVQSGPGFELMSPARRSNRLTDLCLLAKNTERQTLLCFETMPKSGWKSRQVDRPGDIGKLGTLSEGPWLGRGITGVAGSINWQLTSLYTLIEANSPTNMPMYTIVVVNTTGQLQSIDSIRQNNKQIINLRQIVNRYNYQIMTTNTVCIEC